MIKKQTTMLDTVGPHTVKKFELIESYVKEWSLKLLNYSECRTLIYIDCMSNRGEYIYNGEKILGSGPRVVKILNDFARGYPDKKNTNYF